MATPQVCGEPRTGEWHGRVGEVASAAVALDESPQFSGGYAHVTRLDEPGGCRSPHPAGGDACGAGAGRPPHSRPAASAAQDGGGALDDILRLAGQSSAHAGSRLDCMRARQLSAATGDHSKQRPVHTLLTRKTHPRQGRACRDRHSVAWAEHHGNPKQSSTRRVSLM